MSSPMPVINSISPSSGPTAGGTSVNVSGQNFKSGCRVRFGGVDSPQVTFISSSQLVAVTPAGNAGPATVRVVNPNQQAPAIAQNAFTYVTPTPAPPPSISSVNPSSGPLSGGTQVTIAGQSFAPGCEVKFGGNPAQVLSNSPTLLQVFTPQSSTAGSVTVRVINLDQEPAIAQNAYAYLAPPPPPPPAPAPVVSSVTPPSGPLSGGTMVSIVGANFVNGAQAKFDGKDAQTSFVSNTRLNVTTPPQTTAGQVRVRVVNPDGQTGSRDNAFEYTSPAPPPPPPPAPGPRIVKVEPARGPLAGGTPINVTGENFVNGCVLRVGAADARKLKFIGSTKLTAETPPQIDAGVRNLRVVNPDGQNFVLEGGFTYDAPPLLREVSPNAGPFEQDPNRPQTASLLGAFFGPGAVVRFGTKEARVLKVTPERIDVEVPVPLAKGAVAVSVRNADGQESVLQNGFDYLGRNQAKRPRITKITPLTILEGTDTPVTLKGLNLKQAFDQGLIVVRGPDPNVAQVKISGDGATPGGATLEDTVTFMLRVDVARGLGIAEQLPLVVAASLRPNAAEDLLLEGNSVMLSTVSKTLPVPLGFTANVSEGGPNLLMMVGRNLSNTRLEVWRGNTQLDLSQQQADDEVVFGILPLEGGQAGPLQLRLTSASVGGNVVGTYDLKLLAPQTVQPNLAGSSPVEDGAGFKLQPTSAQFLVGSPTGQTSAVRVNVAGRNVGRNLAVSKPLLNSKRLKPGVGLQLFSTGFELALFDRAVILPAFSRPKQGLVDFSPVNVKVGRVFGLRALSLLLFVRVTLEVQTTLALVPVLDPFNDIFFPDPFNDFAEQLPDPFAGFPGAFVFDLVVSTSVSLEVVFVLGLVKPKQPGQTREQLQVLVAAGIGATVGDGSLVLDGGISFGARLNGVRPLGGTPKVRHLASLKPVPDEAGFRGFYFAERTGAACLPFEFDVTLIRRFAAEAPEERNFVYRVSFCTSIEDGPRDDFFVEPKSLTFVNGDPPAPVRARLVSNNAQLRVPEQVRFKRFGPPVASVQEVDAADNALVVPDSNATGLCQVRAMLPGRGPDGLALLPSPDLGFEVEQFVYSGGLPQAYKDASVTVMPAAVTLRFELPGAEGKALPDPLPVAAFRMTATQKDAATTAEAKQRRLRTVQVVVKPASEVEKVTLVEKLEKPEDGRLEISILSRDTNRGVITFTVIGKTERASKLPKTDKDFAVIVAKHTASGAETRAAVSIVVPTNLATPHEAPKGLPSVKKNLVVGRNTAPPDPLQGEMRGVRATIYAFDLRLTVTDQFGELIGDLYKGSSIFETIDRDRTEGKDLVRVNINRMLEQDSTYIDPVGVIINFEAGNPQGISIQSPGKEADAWNAIQEPQLKLSLFEDDILRNFLVSVDEFPLKSADQVDVVPGDEKALTVRNRRTLGVPPYLFIIWPPEKPNPNLRPPKEAPGNLSAKVEGRSLELTWTYKAGDQEGFIVESDVSNQNDFILVGGGTNVLTYKDPKVFPNNYVYRVTAYNKDGLGPPSTVNVTIKGAQPPAVSLPAAVKLTATPTALRVVRGQATAFDIGVGRTNFDGPVNLSVDGLPPGATANIRPNPVNGSAAVSISTGANTPAVTTNINVRGAAPGVDVAPIGVGLTIEAPTTRPGGKRAREG